MLDQPCDLAPAEPAALTFGAAGLVERLDALDPAALDAVGFGVIAMDREGQVLAYNRFESQRAGLSPERVLGRDFFRSVGPCTDNHLVAGRYDPSRDLDEELDYVFTFRMRPTPVRLRLLAGAGAARQYLLVRPRD